mmetsp:Transcript_56864/g.176383  ORF Transcript_56864/g.176383 Transcript_56864/m.176383 type:complete len:231 (+) Transcript_56864:1632-2324(+)
MLPRDDGGLRAWLLSRPLRHVAELDGGLPHAGLHLHRRGLRPERGVEVHEQHVVLHPRHGLPPPPPADRRALRHREPRALRAPPRRPSRHRQCDACLVHLLPPVLAHLCHAPLLLEQPHGPQAGLLSRVRVGRELVPHVGNRQLSVRDLRAVQLGPRALLLAYLRGGLPHEAGGLGRPVQVAMAPGSELCLLRGLALADAREAVLALQHVLLPALPRCRQLLQPLVHDDL